MSDALRETYDSRLIGSGRAVTFAQICAGSVLAFAGLSKPVDGPGATIVTLMASGWVKHSAADIVGRVLPWVELGLALWLATGLLARTGLVVVTIVFVTFIVVLARIALTVGWTVECGCFGPTGTSVAVSLIVDGIVLSTLITALVLRAPPRPRICHTPGTDPG